ncbi:MAG: phosphoenolpyruvate--protein phosphotransferase [Verrucomicrobiae bacterium]|nr:phosphoenolpyruvate--protein phosphotransferase [Verrucomicrobiae bacterium]
MHTPPHKGEKVYRGIPASGGVCRGKVFVLGKGAPHVPKRQLGQDEIPAEIERLERALAETMRQVLEIQQKVASSIGLQEASIFDAHLLILQDTALLNEVSRLIKDEGLNAEFAFHTAVTKYCDALSKVPDEFLRERAADIRDVTARVLNNLLGRHSEAELRQLTEPCILVAHDLSASITAQLDRNVVLGFATDIGSQTSHAAIMARSLRIPAVVGLKTITDELVSGDDALLDGYNGVIVVNPSDQTLFEYGQLARRKATLEERLREVVPLPAVTLDGKRIPLLANIERPGDAECALAAGAEGVGLFRTEYLFINRESLPSEEEQYTSYRQAVAALGPRPVVIRTLDLGGDKFVSHLDLAPEINPFLGWRAIRFCLQRPDVFRVQLRAILRASAHGKVKMMYPMISSPDEVDQANALVEKCKAELRAEGLPFDENIEVGGMIETPSAALVADALAKRLKFFSIGTNDLIQYAIAADRTNERVAHLYEPTHPAIARLIKLTVDAAHAHNIAVSVCGEMAGDPVLVPLLLGLGVDELSAAPALVPQVKYLIRSIKLSEARELAEFALSSDSASAVLARAQQLLARVAPQLLEIRTGTPNQSNSQSH